MGEPAFTDRTLPPSPDELRGAVGRAQERWMQLEDWVRETYGIEGEPIFFGRDSGWCLRFRRSGRALFTLIPRIDGFGALVVIGPSAWAAADSADLSDATRAAWDRAHPYPDGRWLWLDVVDDRLALDVEHLVALKSPPPKRRRVTACA
jgi:hypothetical protein